MAEQPADADVAQLVERNLAKVEVAGSNLVIRSNRQSRFPAGERLLSFLATMRAPTLAAWVLTAAGLLLWAVNLAHERPLFIDEANVVRNLYDRSYAGLFLPLDHAQYAGPGYLVLTKFLAELLGYHEWVLRLPAFAGGLLAVFGLWRASGSILSGYARLLPLALLFSNPTVLRYVTEVKPYGLDLGIAACLLAFYLRPRPPSLITWTVLGALLPWFSLPAVFVLAAIGLVRLYQDRRWLLVIGGWLLSFGLLYVVTLRPSVGSGYLVAYHQEYFFPTQLSIDSVARLGRICWRYLRLSFGFTVVAILWGAGSQVIAALQFPRWNVLLLPLLIVVGVSAFQFYSLIDRLILFVLPGVWLHAARGADYVAGLAAKQGVPYRYAWGLLTVVALGGTQNWRYVLPPLETSDARRLAAYATEPNAYADRSAEPVLDYYLRIDPQRTATAELRPATTYPSDESYTVLFDVTTLTENYARAEQVAHRAQRQSPHCEVAIEELYRARVVRVKCPARNSDP